MSNPALVTSTSVRVRYGGVTAMTIHRWLRNESLGFPQPIYINRRRYWREADLDAFDRRAAGSRDKAA